MAQQINLYSPILLTTKRYFSAQAMVQALLAIALGALALCAWTVVQTASLRKDLQVTQRSHDAERQLLVNAIAANPALGSNTTALEQNLKALQQAVAQRQMMLDELTRGTITDGRSHSAMLRLVAQTVPAPVWLTEVNLATGRIEVVGMTLEPAVLRPWIAQLSADPLLAGQRLGTVRVERAASGATGNSSTAPAPTGTRAPANGLEAWAFTLGSGTDKPAPAVSTAAANNTPNASQIAEAAITNMATSLAASSASGAKP